LFGLLWFALVCFGLVCVCVDVDEEWKYGSFVTLFVWLMVEKWKLIDQQRI